MAHQAKVNRQAQLLAWGRLAPRHTVRWAQVNEREPDVKAQIALKAAARALEAKGELLLDRGQARGRGSAYLGYRLTKPGLDRARVEAGVIPRPRRPDRAATPLVFKGMRDEFTAVQRLARQHPDPTFTGRLAAALQSVDRTGTMPSDPSELDAIIEAARLWARLAESSGYGELADRLRRGHFGAAAIKAAFKY